MLLYMTLLVLFVIGLTLWLNLDIHRLCGLDLQPVKCFIRLSWSTFAITIITHGLCNHLSTYSTSPPFVIGLSQHSTHHLTIPCL